MSAPDPAKASDTPDEKQSDTYTAVRSAVAARKGMQSVPRRAPEEERQGVLPRRLVRIASFGVISLSIFACAVLCLLAVWDFTTSGSAYRAVASLGIISAAMVLFVFVNDLFGGVRGFTLTATPKAG